MVMVVVGKVAALMVVVMMKIVVLGTIMVVRAALGMMRKGVEASVL